ncbi:MAG: PAS domain-containing protein [Chitinivibrionales bacterium]
MSDQDKNERITFDQIRFESDWDYKSPTGSFEYISGAIPERLVYSKIKGKILKKEMENLIPIFRSVYSYAGIQDSTFLRIVDYSEVKKAPLLARRKYAEVLNTVNKEFNSYPCVTYICGASAWLRSALMIMRSFVKQKFVFVDSVEEAFTEINQGNGSSEFKNDNIVVNKSDILEIIDLAGNLLLNEDDSQKSLAVSDKNPLKEIGSLLDLVNYDLQNMRQRNKEDQKAINLSEEKFRKVADNSPDFVFITDPDGRFRYANQAALNLFGYSSDELLNMSIHDLIREDHLESYKNSISEAEKNRCLLSDLCFVTKDRNNINVSLYSVILLDNSIYGTCRDISGKEK